MRFAYGLLGIALWGLVAVVGGCNGGADKPAPSPDLALCQTDTDCNVGNFWQSRCILGTCKRGCHEDCASSTECLSNFCDKGPPQPSCWCEGPLDMSFPDLSRRTDLAHPPDLSAEHDLSDPLECIPPCPRGLRCTVMGCVP